MQFVYIFIYKSLSLYIYIFILGCIFLFRLLILPGEEALQRFPQHSGRIKAIMEGDGSFETEDISWISAVLGISCRVTILPESFERAKLFIPDLVPDMTYGTGDVDTHLLFSWQTAVMENREFGHLDLLVPSEKLGGGQLRLSKDDT